MEKENINISNNADFQSVNEDKDKNTSNDYNQNSDNFVQSLEDSNSNDNNNQHIDATCENIGQSQETGSNNNLESTTSQTVSDTTDESLINENKTCKLDKKKDEKLKNFSFLCIPFIVLAIVISLFNMGKVRQPLSFLFLALGLIVLAVCNIIRSEALKKSCNCKSCKNQSRSSMKFAFFYGFAALGLLGVFVFYICI